MSKQVKVRFLGTDTIPPGYRHVVADLTVGRIYEADTAETGEPDHYGNPRKPTDDGRGAHISLKDDAGDWVDANVDWGFELVEE